VDKKFEISPEKLENAATLLKAMAHPMRVAILNLLRNNSKLTVSEIHIALNIEQSTTSHHLGILKDKGVLRSERIGKNSFYFLRNQNLEHIVECLNKCADCES
jgi:DNA-binding transcriptional ArsR family regulator